jgi:hypothetical protein
MTVEGGVAIIAALIAGSVALLGFGIDSAIEGLASVLVIWRFTGTLRLSEEAERRAQKLVAASFFLLAPYIAQAAIRALINGEHPATSWVGIGLSIGSIVVMPLLGRAKQRVGARLGSAATAGEGAQNLLCAYMAAGVLAGLVANATVGWRWLDPVIALAIAAFAVSEGREAWAGEGCCVASPIPGIDECTDDCCSRRVTRTTKAAPVIPTPFPRAPFPGGAARAPREVCAALAIGAMRPRLFTRRARPESRWSPRLGAVLVGDACVVRAGDARAGRRKGNPRHWPGQRVLSGTPMMFSRRVRPSSA